MICVHPKGARAVQPFSAESPWSKDYQVEQCDDCGSIWVAPKTPIAVKTEPFGVADEACYCTEIAEPHTLYSHVKLIPEVTDGGA